MGISMRALFGAQGKANNNALDELVRSRVLREQTDLLIKQSGTGFVTAVAAAALIGILMAQSTGWMSVAPWFVAVTAGYVIRQRLMERAQARGSLLDVVRITMIGGAVLGLIITAPAPIFYPSIDDASRAFLTMVHLTWATAAITVLGVFPPTYKVYLTCVMVNLSLGWWLSDDTRFAFIYTLLALPLWLVLTRFSNRVGQLIEESVAIRHEREVMVGQLQEALVQTEIAQRTRSRFLASASHDLLQPVHALLLLTSLSRDMPAGPRRDDVLRQLHVTAESIDAMFRGLLDLARFEAGTMQPQLTSMPVAHVLRAIQGAYQSRCAAKGVMFTMELPPGVFVHADPAMFDRIVRNLVDNAVKFTPRGSIIVRCWQHDHSVSIAVCDTGVGIAPFELDQVQEAFFRGSSANEVEADGVGLGLANGTQMATLLHGSVVLQSQQGVGTTATFTLPAGHNPQTEAIAPLARKPMRYKCIALVEDDRTARLATEMWLQERGVKVVAAADVASVIALCEAHHWVPDFVLSDFKLLDGATGTQAIRALRARFGPLPAAIVSGENLNESQVPANVPVLAKPLRPERLDALLSEPR